MRTHHQKLFGGLLAFALGAVLIVSSAAAQAQTGTIAGQITEQGVGTPLAGVRVFLGGTNRSALTNAEGRYTLAGVPVGTHDVRASMLGFFAAVQSVTVAASGIVTADFVMKPTAVSLDAVVVTATGEQRIREMGNAVSMVQTAELEAAPVSNFGQLLTGRTSNVQVLPSSGTTGTGTRIRIRGLSSISLGNEPVYYVDGVRVESASGSLSVGTGGQSISRINDINPEEIESVEIVKGPSAATLYGTQSANGVVLITTKRGKAGRTSWSLWTEGGMLRDNNSYPTNYLSWGRTLPAGTALTQCTIFGARATTPTCVIDSLTSFNVLESDLGINGTGYRGQTGLQVSGGNESVRYFASGEYEEEIGHIRLPDFEYNRITAERRVGDLPYEQFRPNALKRISVRSNVDATLSRTVDVSLRTGLVFSDTRLPQNDNNVTGILPSGLFGKGYRGTGPFGGDYGFSRPGEVFAVTSNQDITRLTGAANAQWRVTSKITARATVGVDYTNRLDTQLQALDEGPAFSTNRTGTVQDNRQSILQSTVDVNATGNFSFSPSMTSKTSVGLQFLRDYAFNVNANGLGLSAGGRTISFTSTRSATEGTAETLTLGAYVEEVVGLWDRLFLTGAVRADDNSAFGQSFNVVVYPKAQASWVVSDEAFFPQSMPIDNLRLRVAYGASGLQPGTTDATQFYSGAQSTVAGVNIPGLISGSLGNPTLKPERSAELELGFDAGFLGDRASLALTYYAKKTRDALINVPQPPSQGGPANRLENLGAVRNSGIEATLSFSVTPSDMVGFDIAISGSRNTNELLDLGGVPTIGGGNVRHAEGYPLFGYWDRPIRSFNDIDGDGVIEWNTDPALREVVVGDTAEFLGYSLPRNELTFNLGINLFRDRVRISGLLDYRGGFKQNNFTEYFRCTSGAANNCQAINDPTAPLWLQARAIAARTSGLAPNGAGATAAGYIEDASFMKFRELSLTYLAPDSWAKVLRATRMSFTVAGRNLKTWTDYTGIDPELNGNGASDSPIDFLTQPPITFWTFKVNLGF